MTPLNPSSTFRGSSPFRQANHAGLRKVRKILIHQVFSACWPLVQQVDSYGVVKVEGFISPSWSTKVKVL